MSRSLPLLDKKAVEAALRARFGGEFLTLRELPDPYAMRDVERAAQRIARAVRDKERIAIVGDYDVDGVVSTALMEEFFERAGYGVRSLIPNRFDDGYGISPELIERLDADVIVTVDNGITAHEAALACRRRGIDLIITDHHTPSDTLPEAYAIVNPKQQTCAFPYPEICGAQVAWFLIGALKRELGLAINMADFLDLLALAIVADVMPLLDINRPLVRKGLAMLSQSKRPAFAVIRRHLGKDQFGAEDVGYGIAPRINSAGRMADASLALAFLRAKSVEEAERLWLELEGLNRRRREVENRIAEEAAKQVRPDDAVAVAAGRGWHEGVVGIVAARLAQRFGKPAVVLSVGEERAKGSGRSVGSVDLYGLLARCDRWLLGFGGHKMAAGLSLKKENIEPFRRAINRAAADLPAEQFVPDEDLMGILPFKEVDWELMEILRRYEPYGEGNPRPRFLFKGVRVREARPVGATGSHLRLRLAQDGREFEAVQFGFDKTVQAGSLIDLAATPQINRFRERTAIQLLVYQIY